ncbi:MAG: hypothetical protein OEZ01_16780 [Candidatus Heimdallarchaeota archaeon]|nr:hypothetical protein [Candidatus Heimdallarchaeota archaeon]
MSFNDEVQAAVSNGDIGVGFLIDDNGNQYWNVGEWEGFNPHQVLMEWKKAGMSAITVGNLKFTVIGKTDVRLVSTNVGGQGHLIGAKCTNWAGYLICWCPAALPPDASYSVVQKLADLVRA